MGRIIESTYVTLDGIMENPQEWSLDYFDEEAGGYALDLLTASEALLMGRATYDSFAETWPGRSGDPFSDKVNAMQKYVASSTLTEPTWGPVTVVPDLAAGIGEIKQNCAGDVLVYGHGPVARLLIEQGHLDELRLWIHPVIYGKAGPDDLLFRETGTSRFTLVDTHRFASGVVVLTLAADGTTGA